MNFSKPDRAKTYENVRYFFKNNKTFDHYLEFSGENRFDIKSPRLEPTGTNKTNFNTKENEMMKILHAQKIVYCVGVTINQCMNTPRRPYKKILIENFINLNTVSNISSMIGYSFSQTQKLKKEACIEFAQRFWSVQYQNNVSDVINLLAFNDYTPVKDM